MQTVHHKNDSRYLEGRAVEKGKIGEGEGVSFEV
jgi:hypothetical protein